MSYRNLRSLFLVGALSFVACQQVTTDGRTILLVDANGDGYAASGACGVEPALSDGCEGGEPVDDCIVYPNPDGCAVIRWTEEHTVINDEEGNVIEDTYTTCTQCLDEDGDPVGEEECSTGGGAEPMVCYTVDSGDPTVSCWECSTPDGELLYGGCDPLPVYCASDAECPDGQRCEIFPSFPECDPNAEVCALAPLFIAEGICTIPVQGCLSDVDCNAGEVCEFVDVPCEGEVCAAVAQGFCTAPREEVCYSDSDCGADEVCQLEDTECPEGMACPTVMTGSCVPTNDGCGDDDVTILPAP